MKIGQSVRMRSKGWLPPQRQISGGLLGWGPVGADQVWSWNGALRGQGCRPSVPWECCGGRDGKVGFWRTFVRPVFSQLVSGSNPEPYFGSSGMLTGRCGLSSLFCRLAHPLITLDATVGWGP